MLTLALIALGSGLGGMARYGCSGVIARRVGETFPWGTLVVNIAGSCLIGLFAGLTAPAGMLAGNGPAHDLVIVGICGGFTTFSSFSLQTLTLAREGEWLRAVANIGLSVLLCLASAGLGFLAGAAIGG